VSRLDGGRLPCQLIGVHSGQEIELSREVIVTPVRSSHRIPALGYVVWERRRKLKAEFTELTGEQIRDLRLSGVDVTEERRIPKVAFMGDSTSQVLDENPVMYDAEILIMEMTFVAPGHRPQLIRKLGHIHLDDVVARRDRFNNQLVIASHFSTRYHPKQIQHYVSRALPDMLDGRLHLWL
ncbi:MAG: metal-dependent hydrolase, partial [Planctomycetales bacterium]|nr:metal-dependent hydrolase [Planctomycetales bacterium]